MRPERGWDNNLLYKFSSEITEEDILFFFGHTACVILVPPPGIESASLALEVWSLNLWTAREIPEGQFLMARALLL